MSSAKIHVPAGGWLCQALAVVLALPPWMMAQPPATPQQTNPPAQTAPMAPLPTVQDLKVIALAGNNEMNDLERRVMALLVVQVMDQNTRPVEGADVVFRFPLTGPGATFANGQTSKKVRTDGRGQATATGWMANGEVGTFQVRVTASYGNETGETTVSMQNVTRIVDQGKRAGGKRTTFWSSPWAKIAIIGGAAAAVVGVVLATRGGSSSSSGTTVTITPGPPTVGGPH